MCRAIFFEGVIVLTVESVQAGLHQQFIQHSPTGIYFEGAAVR